ncbi:DUF2267 domain-containing protein [Rhizobium sp. RU36D]|uniref:DUF2267 domain-containing protein n=1 Tax=Rhizobium sp. RU36D TaxID=1907415 RepID=UPI0009D7D7BC|nr:DUF2267 domain-containing protein [Rhizobium sp. RU36D]SMC67368.1 Uncharacterized conserved protein, DUF2267 family [Rhizobium sp. RU36D]
MPMPMEYRQASVDFDRFMEDLKEVSMLRTSHQAYTMLQAVLQVFRRRLTVAEAIAFAGVLPPVLRAIFVSDWDVSEEQKQFSSKAEMMAEVRALRHNHNLSTESAIDDVATAVRRNVDPASLERVLSLMPEGARAFWFGSNT